MKKRVLTVITTASIFFSLASCGGWPFTDSDEPSELTIKGTAFENSNSGLPTTVRFYALSSDHLFYGYDYFSLTLQDQDVLGVTLKGTLDEQYIEPGSEATFGPYDLPRNTRMVGAVGTFKNIQSAKWRDTVAVTDRGENITIYVVVSRNGIDLMSEKEFRAAEREAEAKVQAQLAADAAGSQGAAQTTAPAPKPDAEDSGSTSSSDDSLESLNDLQLNL